jgi:hypothetical protein
MKLTVEQQEIIENLVDDHHVSMPLLRDDLVDHLCSVVEAGLGKDKSFEQLLNEAVLELAPNGLKSIERETIFLLNYKRIIIMKKVIYLSGFIGSLTLTAGITFTLLHWPGGSELFIAGWLILFLLFIPLLAMDRYKVAISKAISYKLKIILGTIAAVITGLSGLFKLFHLQGAELLLLCGAFVFAVGFLPFLFFTMYKKSVS